MSEDNFGLPAVSLGPVSMPLLGLGTWQISDTDVTAAVHTALETGYRHLDTATGYGNEAGIGRALGAAGLARSEVFLTTKLPPEHGGRERRTLEESLAKLGVDHIDLWLVHWPPGGQAAPEVWQEVVQAQQDGLVTSVGVSNYSLDQIDEITSAVGVAPAVNQIKWGPLLYDPAEVDGLRERGVVLEGYSPLKATDLADPVLVGIADAHGVTPAQAVIAWHVAHGFVVIPKSSRPERIVANAQAARVPLSVDEVEAIDGLAHT